MNKTWLIIKREYISRVRSRTFIITTLLTPLLFALFIAGTTYLATGDKEKMNIAVADNSGYFKNNLKSDDDLKFSFPPGVDTTNYLKKGFSAILIIPQFNSVEKPKYIIRSEKTIGFGTKDAIDNKINAAVEDQLLQQAGVNRTELDSIHDKSQLGELKSFEENGSKTQANNEGLSYGIGYASGILIYITMLIYGMMLMRGVMEEKTNRIAEVIVSSVRPFQLMLGKIIGIGAVGLTQFIAWIILAFAIVGVAHSYFSHDTLAHIQQAQQSNAMFNKSALPPPPTNQVDDIINQIKTANLPLIIGCFIFYFLGGYLFYSALFGAVGSVVEDAQGSQSLTLPITMPIIFSFFIMIAVVQDPNSSLAIWASIIPFSSPMVMMARVAYGVPGTVPYWQLGVSIICLIIGFLFTTWLAAKIYRTGILLYGKKITWKEMLKWGFKKSA